VTRAPYRPDGRSPAELVAALSDHARSARLPPSLRGEGAALPQTWADLLFAGDALANEAEPSQALLRAVAALQARLVDHLDRLPDLARGHLMSERLGIPRLPVVPDHAVVVVDGDPKRMPVVLPRGSLLKAGKTGLGERLYATTEALTVLGAPVVGAHSHGILATGRDVATWRRSGLSDGKVAPFAPFGDPGDPLAAHELVLTSDLLRFSRGTLTVTLTFEGVTVNGAAPGNLTPLSNVLKALRWSVSAPDGETRPATISQTQVGTAAQGIRLTMTVAGGSDRELVDGTPRYFVRASFPSPETSGFDRQTALGFAFTNARLKVAAANLLPDAAYAGGGLLDVTKEFEPFGPVPRRGDSFFLRLDEAFGKPLTYVAVSLTQLTADRLLKAAEYGFQQARDWADQVNARLDEEGVGYRFDAGSFATPDFTVRWDRFDGTEWTRVSPSAEQTDTFRSLETAVSPSSGAPFSAPTSVGGSEGHFVRAFLYRGDFGWAEFQETMAENAAKVARGDGDEVEAALPPDPPVVTQVRVAYETAEVSSAAGSLDLYARNALSSLAPLGSGGAGGAYHPFRQDEDGFEGAFFLGVGDPLPLGEVVTVYADLDEADACAAVQEPNEVAWQYKADGGTWRDLPCVDGTLGLRQSGVLRFVAPLDWLAGAPEADESAGHWIRARTAAPSAAGRVRLLRTDAVEAVYRLAPGHANDDPTPATPLPAGEIKALRAPVLGIKKVTNPAPSTGGRAPEPDPAFFARSGGVVRHRNRAVTAWDVERLVEAEFPELALVRCLPHHSAAGTEEAECTAGWLAVVAVPDSEDREPVPTVRLAAAIEAFVRAHGAVDLAVAVLCPLYVPVGVRATLHLVPGVPAATAREEVEGRLWRYLHPLSTTRRGGFGEPLYRSAVVRFLEEQPAVDHVSDVDLVGPHAGLERVDVDACRGLVASAAVHELFGEAAL
jgi:hypothetical protein